MRSVLIAGCGYVGAATADAFHQAGWGVEGWTRSPASAAQLSDKPYPVYALDLSDAAQVAARSAGREFDAIVHSASTRGGDAAVYRRVYGQGAQNLLQQFGRSTVLFTSSTSVYGQKDGEWVTEQSPADPEHETGRILRETENLVLARGGMVARLAGIYGPERSALLRKFLNGQAMIDRETDRFINQVHRDDVAAALFLLLSRPAAPNEIYNVADDRPVRQSEYYGWLAQKLNRPVPAMGKESSPRKRGRSNKRVSSAKLRALGWIPRYPSFVEGMEKSVLPASG